MRRGLIAVLATVALAGGASAALLLQGDDNDVTTAPVAQPSPYPIRTPLLGEATRGPAPQDLRTALSLALKDPRLGARVSLTVADVASERVLLDVHGDRAVTPASTAKIATAVAALGTLPRDGRLVTRVMGGRPGEIVLVGAGDPTLAGKAAARTSTGPRLSDLAAQVRRWSSSTGTTVTRVVVDDSLFTGPRLGPGWKGSYVQDGDVAPVDALSVDAGRTSKKDGAPRVSDPALQAGRQLAALVGAHKVVRGRAARGATVIAHVSSQPFGDLVEQMLTRSDNDLAEALGRHVARAAHLPATFAGEAAAITAALRQHGVDVALADASGLSRKDRVEPAQLTTLLVHAARDGSYAPLLTGLPVAGFDGTLADRYRTGPSRTAAGEVRAKTGTLDGVSALAGYVRTRDGRLLAFDLTADGVPVGATKAAQAALDRLAAVLAGCGCR